MSVVRKLRTNYVTMYLQYVAVVTQNPLFFLPRLAVLLQGESPVFQKKRPIFAPLDDSTSLVQLITHSHKHSVFAKFKFTVK